mgnify:CR=1 FL=1
MKTKHFGDALQMEVGALMVGKIVNHDGAGSMRRGIEKGYFSLEVQDHFIIRKG